MLVHLNEIISAQTGQKYPMKIHYVLLRRGFDTFYGSYLGVLDHFTHVRDKYEGYDFHQNEKVLFNASGRFEADT